MVRENRFQASLIKDIYKRFPDALVLKNDPNYIQGIPDLLVLIDDKWFALETKRASNAAHRPNQDFYIPLMDEMSYARFVYPENKEEVLDEIQQALRPRGKTRVPKPKQVPLD